MRISGWSSDVCSSDLLFLPRRHLRLWRKVSLSPSPGKWVRRRQCHLARLSRRVKKGASPAMTETGMTLLRSEEHTSELQSLMRISYAVFCLKKKKLKKDKPIRQKINKDINNTINNNSTQYR